MLVFCPRCGAEYPELAPFEHTSLHRAGPATSQCRDCGVAVAKEDFPILEPDDDQVAFVLDDWPVEFRGEATAVLADNGIPYRWEAGFALVVPAEMEDRVDALLDEAEAAAEEGLADDDEDDDYDEEDDADDDGDEDDDALEGEVVDADDEEGDDEVEEDGGDEAQQAMSDLYLVSDRLKDQPWDDALRAEMTQLATQVNALLPPYGIDRRLWNRIGDLAGAVAADIERGAEDDEVAASTVALRLVVRDYV